MHSYNSIIHAKQSLLLFVNLANYYIFDSFYTIEMIKNDMGHIIDNFFGDGRCRRDPRVDRFLTSGLTLTLTLTLTGTLTLTLTLTLTG